MKESEETIYVSSTRKKYNSNSIGKDFDAMQKKCGIIYKNQNQNLSFSCIFCETLLKDVNAFMKHIKIYHLKLCKQTNNFQKGRNLKQTNNWMENYKILNIQSINDEQIQEVKCGEILINFNEILNFSCILCETLLKDVETFERHIKIYHLKKYKQKDSVKLYNKERSSLIKKFSTTTTTMNISNPLQTTIEETTGSLDLELNFSEMNYNDERNVEENNSEEQLDDTRDQFDEPEFSLEIDVQPMEGEEEEEEQQEEEKKTYNKSISKKKKCKMNAVCNICNESFFSKLILKSHQKYDHLSLEASTQEHTIEIIPLKDPFHCRYCEKKFRSRNKRYEHECSHTGENPYECNICGKRFYIKNSYNEHLKIHKNERKFKCKICHIGFNNSSNLIVHMKRHGNDKKFKCLYCDKKFVSSIQCKIHIRIHTNEKPYECKECGKYFLSSGVLNKHFIRHHITVKPYKCDYCKKDFASNREKQEHERIHTGEKPYNCGICNKSFRRITDIKRHRRLHTKKILYNCQICGDSFENLRGLKNHMKFLVSHRQLEMPIEAIIVEK